MEGERSSYIQPLVVTIAIHKEIKEKKGKSRSNNYPVLKIRDRYK